MLLIGSSFVHKVAYAPREVHTPFIIQLNRFRMVLENP